MAIVLLPDIVPVENMRLQGMDLNEVIKAAGLWDEPASAERSNTLLAFYNRPWSGTCTLDDICMQAIEYKVDVRPLIKMAEYAGEIDTSPQGEERK